MKTRLAAAIRARPTHVVLKCRDATLANLVGLALVRAASPHSIILEIRPSDPQAQPDRINWSSVVPLERLFTCTAPPDSDSTARGFPEGSWPIARADKPDRPISDLIGFLTAPEAAGHSMREHLPQGRPLPVLVANGWRVAHRLPDDRSVTAHLLRVQKEIGMSVVMTADEAPRDDYLAFDLIFTVLPPTDKSSAARIRCERAALDQSIRPGDELSVGEVGAVLPPARDRGAPNRDDLALVGAV